MTHSQDQSRLLQRPFPGLQSFTEDKQNLFFGRSDEIEELARLIGRDAATVLFGRSGLGKTSLLQAGLFPLLRRTGYLPIPIRLLYGDGHDAPIDQIKSAVAREIATHQIDAPPPLPEQTLWEYFHATVFWDRKNRLLTPVLVFDQFEEVFTVGREDARTPLLLDGLEELIENIIPATVAKRLENGEDLAYSYQKLKHRVIVSLREDFLPQLESLTKRIPSLRQQRMRLTPLNGEQALEAIRRPAHDLLDADSARQIVSFVGGMGEADGTGPVAETNDKTGDVADLEVEPSLLALVCYELNERRIERGLERIDTRLLDVARNEILTDFYERSLKGLPDAARILVEDRLLTGSGFRATLALDDAIQSPGVSRPTIDALVDRRLLRVDVHLGIPHLELTHDVLTGVVASSRQTRRADEQRVRERRRRQQMRRRYAISSGIMAACALIAVAVAVYSVKQWREEQGLREQFQSTLNRLEEEQEKATRARIERLLDVQIDQLPEIIARMDLSDEQMRSALESTFGEDRVSRRRKLRAALALQTVSDAPVSYLREQLLSCPYDEFAVISDAMTPRRDQLTPELWEAMTDSTGDGKRFLRSAMVLADMDPPDEQNVDRWRRNIGRIVNRMVIAIRNDDGSPESRGESRLLVEQMRPIADQLRGPLLCLYESEDTFTRRTATRVMIDLFEKPPIDPFADPATYGEAKSWEDMLFDVALVADVNQLGTLTAAIDRRKGKMADLVSKHLTDPNEGDRSIEQSFRSEINEAGGWVGPHDAFCFSLSPDQFIALAEMARPLGFRPTRVRPSRGLDGLRFSVIWLRDFRPWWFSMDLTIDQVRLAENAWQANSFAPSEIAGYHAPDVDKDDGLHYLAVWSAIDPQLDEVIMNAGMESSQHEAWTKENWRDGLGPLSLQVVIDAFGVQRVNAIWRRDRTFAGRTIHRAFKETSIDTYIGEKTVLHDVNRFETGTVNRAAYWARRIANLEQEREAKPDDLSVFRSWVYACYHAGRHDVPLRTLPDIVHRDGAAALRLHYWYCLHAARSGNKSLAAQAAGAHGAFAETTDLDRRYLAAVTAIYSGNWDAARQALRALDPDSNTTDAGYLYDAACAYSVASEFAEDSREAGAFADAALSLLRRAFDSGWSDPLHVQIDSDMNGIRTRPEFEAILEEMQKRSAQYSAIWQNTDSKSDSVWYRNKSSAPDAAPPEGVQRNRSCPVAVAEHYDKAAKATRLSMVWNPRSEQQLQDLEQLRDAHRRLRQVNALTVLKNCGEGRRLLDLIRDESVKPGEFLNESVTQIREEIRSIHSSGRGRREELAGDRSTLLDEWQKQAPNVGRGNDDRRNASADAGPSSQNLDIDFALIMEIEQIKHARLAWDETTGSARKWWIAFEDENLHRLTLVKRLAEELAKRDATITEFFLAYVYSNTDNIQANLHYMDFLRLKKAYAKAKKDETVVLDTFAEFRATFEPVERELQDDDRLYADARDLIDRAELSDGERQFARSVLFKTRDAPIWFHTLSDELTNRNASFANLLNAAADSNIEDVMGLLHYIDFVRLREEEAAKKAEKSDEGADEKTDDYVDFAAGVLREFAVARTFKRIPPRLPPMRKAVENQQDLDAAKDDMLLILKEYSGEIDGSVVYFLVGERRDLLRVAIERGLTIDIPTFAKDLSRAAKYLVHEKEIAWYLTINLPRSPELSEAGRANLEATRNQVLAKWGPSLEGLGRTLGVDLDEPVAAFNRESSKEDLRQLADELKRALFCKDLRNSAAILRGLVPDNVRLAKAIHDRVPDAARNEIALIASSSATVGIGASSIGTSTMIYEATFAQIMNGDPAARLVVPANRMNEVAAVLRPGTTFYTIRFYEENKRDRWISMVYWDGSKWAMLGPVWLAKTLEADWNESRVGPAKDPFSEPKPDGDGNAADSTPNPFGESE